MNWIIEFLKSLLKTTASNNRQYDEGYEGYFSHRGARVRSGEEPALMEQVRAYVLERYELRYNVIREQTELRPKDDPAATFRAADKRVLNSICFKMQCQGIRCWDRDLLRFIESEEVPAYHPFRLYMEELPAWDGRDRVTDLARRVSRDEAWVADFHRWMLGMAAQWMGLTGVHANSVAPVLISREQGRLKSTFCRSLLPEALSGYYTDSFDVTSQGSAEQKMAELGLINLDEFDKYPESRMSQLKNLLQASSLNMRKAYQRKLRELPRVASFIATSNRIDLLTDLTGSRRFICVEVEGKIDCEYIEHQQVYAQLKAELERGERYWFCQSDEAALQQRNKRFIRTSVALDLFLRLFRATAPEEACQPMSLDQIAGVMQRENPLVMRSVNLNHLGRDICACGIERRHTLHGNVYFVAKRS